MLELYTRKSQSLPQFQQLYIKIEKIELLDEILQMYDEDVQNPQVDMSAMRHIVYSDKADMRLRIQYFDLIWILGLIIYNLYKGYRKQFGLMTIP